MDPNLIAGSRRFGKSEIDKTTVGASLTMGPFKLCNPVGKFKVVDLTDYEMNYHRWTRQRKKTGLKGNARVPRWTKVRNEKMKERNINFILDNFKRKECCHYCRSRYQEKIAGKEVCFCGLTHLEHVALGATVSSFHNVTEKRSSKPTKLITQVELEESWTPTIIAEEVTVDIPNANMEIDCNYRTENETLSKDMEASGITSRSRKEQDNKKICENETETVNKVTSGRGKKWSFSNSVTYYPTDAYGKIDFVIETSGSNKPAKYLRLSDDSDMGTVVKMMKDYWRLLKPNRPHLIISVTGGAKNFKLDGKKKETFNLGLIRAVKSTNAWLLTGGTNVGVAKTVGEAVNKGQYMVKNREHMTRGIKCLGVAPWGYVKDNHLLINNYPDEFPVVRYKVEQEVKEYQNLSLNGDHTHFLLIDNGIRNRYNGADQFRADLLKAVQEAEPKGLGIPGVLLILEGGITSVIECLMALENNIPVVVFSNTGRAADLLAYAISMTVQTQTGKYVLRKEHQNQLLIKVYSLMTELPSRGCEKCASIIIQCCDKANLITVFDINSNEGMDKYILCALLQGEAQDVESSKMDQLKLALLWNRPDIAESRIFPSYFEWSQSALEELMTTALQEQKISFAALLISNGVIMSDYLTVSRLRKLYNDSCTENSHVGRLLQVCSKSTDHYLCHVHLLLQAMMRRHNDLTYMADTPQLFPDDPSISKLTFKDPYQELLIWAVFTNRGDLAFFLWERCNRPALTAIAASCLYDALWNSLGAKNTNLRNEYLQQKNRFESLAVEFIDRCHKDDVNNSIVIVECSSVKWGDLDCIQLAVLANDKHFISSACCQTSVELNWRRGMIRASTFSVILANFFPLLVWTTFFRFQKLGDDRGELTRFQKLIVFYKSPISKFYAHSSAFVIFLILYSYVVLFDFRPAMTVTEVLVIFWIFSNITDEFHEVLQHNATSIIGKIVDWWSLTWNRPDVVSYGLAIIALLLRSFHFTFKSGRIVFALNTTVFYIRLLRIYHVNYKLGPKLVIFYRMITEVQIFLALLAIFILGYGIASQALLHPWRTFENANLTTLANEILLTPYWQMYGELLLNKVEDSEHCQISARWNKEVCENPRDYTWVTNMMLFFYLIIGNIMLVNLLIAIFTYVFYEVQENSMEIWKFERCRLVEEYDSKPILVPPFSLLEHIYSIGNFLRKKFIHKNRGKLNDSGEGPLKAISIFEKEAMISFLYRRQAKEDEKIENVASRISEKVDRLIKHIDHKEELKEIEQDIDLTTETEVLQGRTGRKITRGKDSRSLKFKNVKAQRYRLIIDNKDASHILTTKAPRKHPTDDDEETDHSADDQVDFRKPITEECGRTRTATTRKSSTVHSRLLSCRSRHPRFIRDESKVMERQQGQIINLRKKIDVLQLCISDSQAAVTSMLEEVLSKLDGRDGTCNEQAHPIEGPIFNSTAPDRKICNEDKISIMEFEFQEDYMIANLFN